MHNVFSTTGVFSKVADCKNLTAEIRLQYDDSFFLQIDEHLSAIEGGKAKKEEWEDEQNMTDSEDEYDETIERIIQVRVCERMSYEGSKKIVYICRYTPGDIDGI